MSCVIGTYIRVLHLQHLEELLELGSSEVSDGAQASEETALGYLLEVPLTDVLQSKVNKGHVVGYSGAYEHGGPDVVFLFELRDKHVHGHQVTVLHLPDDVRQPFELALRPGHPQEVHLTTTHTVATAEQSKHSYLLADELRIGSRFVLDVLEDGSKRCDSDAAAHQHSHLVAIPLLVPFSVRPIQEDLQSKLASHYGSLLLL